MWPVYLGLASITRTFCAVHPVAGLGGGQAAGLALSRAAMAGQPSLPAVRHAYMRAMTGARTGSRMSRDLVRPWAALNGTGCGMRWAAYPYGGEPMFHPSRECSTSP